MGDLATADELVETDEGTDDALVTGLRLTLLAIYLLDLVVVVDLLTHGAVREKVRVAWGWVERAVLAPARAREEERRSASHLIFEAMQIVEEARERHD